MMTNEKRRALEKIRRYSFAVDEARLFLDSHPECKDAIRFYEKNLEAYKNAVEDYERRFAPIGKSGAISDGKWVWNTTPWPWERSEN